jgi:hypothetical protein
MDGVQFNSPPIDMQETIIQHIQPKIAEIPEDKHVGIFGVTYRDASTGKLLSNAVIAVKVDNRLEVGGWIGKTWGDKGVDFGVEAKLFF